MLGSPQVVELQMCLSLHLCHTQLITSGQEAAEYLDIC